MRAFENIWSSLRGIKQKTKAKWIFRGMMKGCSWRLMFSRPGVVPGNTEAGQVTLGEPSSKEEGGRGSDRMPDGFKCIKREDLHCWEGCGMIYDKYILKRSKLTRDNCQHTEKKNIKKEKIAIAIYMAHLIIVFYHIKIMQTLNIFKNLAIQCGNSSRI